MVRTTDTVGPFTHVNLIPTQYKSHTISILQYSVPHVKVLLNFPCTLAVSFILIYNMGAGSMG